MLEQTKKLWKDRKKQTKYIKWIVSYTKPYLGKIVGIMALNLSSTVITLVMTLVTKRIIVDATQ